MYSINTFPLSDFILLYCDKDYSFVNNDTEAAKKLIREYEEAIIDTDNGRNEQVGEIEALNSFLSRMKTLHEVVKTIPDPRLMSILYAELRFKHQGSHEDDLSMIEAKIAGHQISYNQKKAEFDKQNEGKTTVTYDWFIDTCVSMSDINKYAIKIQDLTVKEFTVRYKQLLRYIAKMNEKKTTA